MTFGEAIVVNPVAGLSAHSDHVVLGDLIWELLIGIPAIYEARVD